MTIPDAIFVIHEAAYFFVSVTVPSPVPPPDEYVYEHVIVSADIMHVPSSVCAGLPADVDGEQERSKCPAVV
jgi:hypothetical protein